MAEDRWDPQQYDRFRAERQQPFFDLLALVQRRPLDVEGQERGVPDWIRPYLPLLFVNDELRAVANLFHCDGGAAAAEWRVTWTGHPFDGLF